MFFHVVPLTKIWHKNEEPDDISRKIKELSWTIIEISNLLEKANKLQKDYKASQIMTSKEQRVAHKGHEGEYLEYPRHLFVKTASREDLK